MNDIPRDPQSIEMLIRELHGGDDIKAKQARESLVELGGEAVPPLTVALRTGKDWMRWEAAKALGEIGDPASIPALAEALRDKSFDVRWLAAKALINIGWKSIIPVVEELMAHPGSVWMRDGAHHVLHDLSYGRFKDPLMPILTMLEGIEPAVQIPLMGRRALETLEPVAMQTLKEEEAAEQARIKAEKEAAEQAEKEAGLKTKLQRELGRDRRDTE